MEELVVVVVVVVVAVVLLRVSTLSVLLVFLEPVHQQTEHDA